MLNLVADLDRLAPAGSAHRGSWWTRPSFDVSVWESWSPLLHGGTVVVVPDECRLEGPRLAGFLSYAEVGSAYVPGAFLPDLLALLRTDPEACAGLARLLVGVEPIPLGVLQDLMEARPRLTVVNGYGPAEATICCTLHPVPRVGGDRAGRTPIGRAVTGNRLYVVDEDGRPAASGTGELVVAGTGVARGYIGAPASESARFVPDPAGGGGRAYRTGDLVRTLPDGDLVFEGRADRQLKVRGHRVEPGEVETALRAAAGVRDVVVGRRELVDGEASIVAYVVPAPGAASDPGRVTARLREVLPSWAVPARIVTVGAIPLTPNGKIDHDALAAVPVRPEAGGPLPPGPRTGTERRLVEIWRSVLGVSPIGVRDGFVELGGHSLSAARICARVREEFGREVSVADLLAATTVEALAEVVDAAAAADGPVTAAAPRARYPLAFAQERLWLLDRIMPGSTDYTLFEAYRLRGPLDVAALRAALADVVRRQPALRTTFHDDRGVPYQVVAEDTVCVFDVIDAEESAGVVDALVEREARRPFRLGKGPLLRTTLLRLGPGHHVLLIVVHHIVADDWSMDVLWSDLRACYRARAAGATPPSPR